jgi:phage shock protein PspC (stress-responsive transcriptional regulator)
MVGMEAEQTSPPPPDAGFDPQRLREAPLQMRRSRTDRHVAGVCGGFARYARIDPVVVRVVIAALAITGAGIVLYLAAWVLVPEEGSDRSAVDGLGARSPDDLRRVGWVVAAVLAFAALFSAGPWFDVWFPWPLLAIALLVWLWLARDKDDAPAEHAAPAYPAPGYPAYAAAPPPSGTAATSSPAPYAGSEPACGGTGTATAGSPPPPYVPPAPVPPRRPRRRRGDGSLAILTLGVALVALGVLWAVDRTVTPVDGDWVAATLLGVTGLGMLVGAVVGDGRRLAPVAVVAAIALVVSSQVTVWRAGEIDQTPTTAAQVKPVYELGAGNIRLDLSRVEDLDQLDGRTVAVSLSAGDVRVVIPDGLDLTVVAEQRVGELRILDERESGFANELTTSDPDTTDPDLRLVIENRVGNVKVERR